MSQTLLWVCSVCGVYFDWPQPRSSTRQSRCPHVGPGEHAPATRNSSACIRQSGSRDKVGERERFELSLLDIPGIQHQHLAFSCLWWCIPSQLDSVDNEESDVRMLLSSMLHFVLSPEDQVAEPCCGLHLPPERLVATSTGEFVGSFG